MNEKRARTARDPGPKTLAVVAHPDDEYVFAATLYRITHELGGTVDQVVITNGEAGYRYSHFAQAVYGCQLTHEPTGRKRLPAIRKQETLNAGRILGIRRHHFLEQKDARFTRNADEALEGMWDTNFVLSKLDRILESERYDYLLILLPAEDTHGHHKSAAFLTWQAVSRMPHDERPVVLGSEPAAPGQPLLPFTGPAEFARMKVIAGSPVFVVDRQDSFGPAGSLNYNIVVHWVIAEHKSQGLFQTEYGKHTHEQFWVFDTGSDRALASAAHLFSRLASTQISRAA